MERDDNPLRHAPHTASAIAATDWTHGYSREQAAFPLDWVRDRKFWPSCGRIDNGYGDKNLICTCEDVESYASAEPPKLAMASVS